MKPAPFTYAKARSLDHAIELLGSTEESRLLAGGQSLMATLNMRLSAPRLLVDLNGVSGLGGVAVKNDAIEIGALTRHAEAERSADIAKHAPLIALALPHIGHPAIRNRGTLGGSIAFADPAAELPPACSRSTARSRSPAPRESARSRPTTSSRVCSRPRSGRMTC